MWISLEDIEMQIFSPAWSHANLWTDYEWILLPHKP